MILPYASDEEIDKNGDEINSSIINDKDIKLETSEMLEDNNKNNNLFPFDVKIFSLKFLTFVSLVT